MSMAAQYLHDARVEAANEAAHNRRYSVQWLICQLLAQRIISGDYDVIG